MASKDPPILSLATIREPVEAEVKNEEENHNEISKRLGSTITTINEGKLLSAKVEQIVHMVGGTGEISYAKNSIIQAKVILKAKPIVEKAIREVYKTLIPMKFVAADLGCSSGPNTFLVISEIISVIHELSRRLDISHQSEIQIFLNDLPGNDFNNIFRSLMDYKKQIKEDKGENFVPFYISGSPGSFYTRLFPSKSIHFFHSSYSQMWLSQVPRRVDGESTFDELKKESLYLEQFKEDFSTFLKLRSKELIFGGRMVLTIAGRVNNSEYKDVFYMLGLLRLALNDMISEGLATKADRNAINFPYYTPTIEELKSIIQNEESFYLDHVETFESSWDPFEDEMNNLQPDYILRGKIVVKHVQAAVEPLLNDHFDKETIADLFSRYEKIITTHLTKKPKWVNFVLVLKLKRKNAA
ncbi:hypothetical protein M5K25_011532 [Dendrobium thyrsiflorum]|uniref:Uncharacterized protein n=1 Tax=Dendrobium thyrsiflorum TaxID=117978 RepID=A0ABD0VAN0_DENTH